MNVNQVLDNTICFESDLDSRTMQPKFNPTEAQTHDLWIINSRFNVPAMFIVTTEPQGL